MLDHRSHRENSNLPGTHSYCGVALQILSCWLFFCCPTHAAERIDFAAQVAPIFESRCVECHQRDEDNGGLQLESNAALDAATDSGKKAIFAGKPDQSELLRRVIASDEDIRMPPDGERLSPEQVSLLRSWIEQGARWPSTASSEEDHHSGEKHWSFFPVDEPALPEIPASSRPLSPIDYFAQAKRDSEGIQTVGEASAQQLIRRATYGLTGLPPTPKQVETFEASVERSGLELSFSELVDDLLERPAYGERWGRHWMDWVRYADTAGCNSDFPIPQAYLYRNYIIDAFNDDLPYDQFLTEQIAGDLMASDSDAERKRRIIATGYLAMARRFGSLVETYPWHLTIEDTIDNVGRTMLGLTMACARCHDHKFDPISTRDYYGLYGIFASTRYAFPGIELFQVQHDLTPLVSDGELSSLLNEHEEKTGKLEAALTEALSKCRVKERENAELESSSTLAERRKMKSELNSLHKRARKSGNALADHLKKLPDYPSAYAVFDSNPTNARIHIKGEPARQGAEVKRRFPEVLGGFEVQDTKSSGRLELASWITSPENPLTARVIVNRIWQRHFGSGIVGSTSDFGLRGELPSHPELLDWLAADFVKNGWSIKHLHRTIMNSRTYMLASGLSAIGDSKQMYRIFERNASVDPTNRFYWRFNRQRLDAESIRDSMLFISGELDETPQSAPYPIPPQKDWTYTQHHPFKDDYPTNKRSVYQMTKRLTVESYMQTFDGPDPNVCTSKLDQSVTALQALFFVNDDFMHRQAEVIARRLVSEFEPRQDRLSHAFKLILTRAATDQELELMQEHFATILQRMRSTQVGGPDDLADAGSIELDAYASFIRGLLRLNEFVYVD